MDKVRIGFVGCGLMGQLVHLPNLIELENCEVVALAELRPELGRQVAKKHGIPRFYTSHLELAGDPEVEAVVEVVGEDAHARVTTDLLSEGKHVLVEKPLATSVVEGEAMVRAADRSGVMLMVGFMRRFDSGVEVAKRYIDGLRESKEIGEITFVHCHRFGNDWSSNLGEPIATDEPYPETSKTAPLWLPEEMIDRFRTFNSAYSHNVDLLRHLLGEVQEVEYANITSSGKLVVLAFDGFQATIEAGSSPASFWDEVIKVYFSDGWVEIRLPPPLLRGVAADVEVYRAGTPQEVHIPKAPRGWSFLGVDRHFLDCVMRGDEPKSSGKDALETLRVVEAIFARQLGWDERELS